MLKATVRKVGNSLGILLPQELAKALRVEEGDSIFITQGPDGVTLTAYDPAFERQMEVAAKGMRKYRNALRELAK